MNVMVVADGHYFRTPNGDVFAQSVFNYNFYKRYLKIFTKVYVVARIAKVNEKPLNMQLSSGDGVEFIEMPLYTGPWQYVTNYFKIKEFAIKHSRNFDCGIFRIPGATANIMCEMFSRTGKPFAVEVVVDPWEYFAPGTVKSVTRPIVRVSWTRFLEKMCLKANGVSYVTENYLQSKYPSTSLKYGENEYYFSTYYSSVSLPTKDIGYPKSYIQKEKYVISHVANSFATYGKGHITLLNVLKILRENNYNIEIVFVGDGPLKQNFCDKALELGVDQYVTFTGRLSDGEAVKEVIKNSDLFVFPTKAEGLPRALLEAMSVGLPCLSTAVCGIPEILQSEFLFEYDDYLGFANKIIQLIQNPQNMEYASATNIMVSRKYTEETLELKRTAFYSRLYELAKVGKAE